MTVSEGKPAQKYPYILARYVGQAVAYAAFLALLGFFATAPAYSPIDPNAAMIKLSFIHVGQRKVECRKMSPEEIARLPPNMRLTLDCPRERLPVLVVLELPVARPCVQHLSEICRAVGSPSDNRAAARQCAHGGFRLHGRHRGRAQAAAEFRGGFQCRGRRFHLPLTARRKTWR
jgi:hypothetical protein